MGNVRIYGLFTSQNSLSDLRKHCMEHLTPSLLRQEFLSSHFDMFHFFLLFQGSQSLVIDKPSIHTELGRNKSSPLLYNPNPLLCNRLAVHPKYSMRLLDVFYADRTWQAWTDAKVDMKASTVCLSNPKQEVINSPSSSGLQLKAINLNNAILLLWAI